MTEPPMERDAAATEAAIAAAIADALRAPPLDQAAINRLRENVLSEWQDTLAGVSVPPRRPYRGRWLAGSAAAAVALLIIGLVLWPAASPLTVATVVRLGAGTMDAERPLWRHRSLQPGDAVRVGDTLTAHGPALLSLAGGGTLRVAADSVLRLVDSSEVSLDHGLVYVDLPPSSKRTPRFQIRTRVGAVEHLGTQFEVLGSEASVRIRVREGRIRLVGPAGAVVASAGVEVTASLRGGISERPIDLYGREWSWVTALAPDFAIEGRSLADFLRWAGRELGRRVEYADPNTEDRAAHTTLHGAMAGQGPLEALTEVLASTSLTFDLPRDSIRVHSAP